MPNLDALRRDSKPSSGGASNLDWALHIVREVEGALVFPCHWAPAPGVCSCGDGECRNVAKHPVAELVPNGLKGASSDPRQITDWWARCPDANLAATYVLDLPLAWLDVDPAKGGFMTWTALVGRLGIAREVNRTVITETGGGGGHFWLRTRRALRNSGSRVGPGIDVRAPGGYVILPPSVHKSGRRYRFLRGHSPGDLPVAGMPPQLEEFIARLEPKPGAAAPRPFRAHADAGEIESALAHIGSDDRDVWLRVGMALHRELGEGGRALWDRWAQSSPKYDARDQARTWRHFRADGAVGIGTLFRLARDAGWPGCGRAA